MARRLSATEEYDGSSWTSGGNLATGRSCFNRSWNSNSWFSSLVDQCFNQVQLHYLQKNIMDQLGQAVELFQQQVFLI
jgi:hypothetical protein